MAIMDYIAAPAAAEVARLKYATQVQQQNQMNNYLAQFLMAQREQQARAELEKQGWANQATQGDLNRQNQLEVQKQVADRYIKAQEVQSKRAQDIIDKNEKIQLEDAQDVARGVQSRIDKAAGLSEELDKKYADESKWRNDQIMRTALAQVTKLDKSKIPELMASPNPLPLLAQMGGSDAVAQFSAALPMAEKAVPPLSSPVAAHAIQKLEKQISDINAANAKTLDRYPNAMRWVNPLGTPPAPPSVNDYGGEMGAPSPITPANPFPMPGAGGKSAAPAKVQPGPEGVANRGAWGRTWDTMGAMANDAKLFARPVTRGIPSAVSNWAFGTPTQPTWSDAELAQMQGPTGKSMAATGGIAASLMQKARMAYDPMGAIIRATTGRDPMGFMSPEALVQRATMAATQQNPGSAALGQMATDVALGGAGRSAVRMPPQVLGPPVPPTAMPPVINSVPPVISRQLPWGGSPAQIGYNPPIAPPWYGPSRPVINLPQTMPVGQSALPAPRIPLQLGPSTSLQMPPPEYMVPQGNVLPSGQAMSGWGPYMYQQQVPGYSIYNILQSMGL